MDAVSFAGAPFATLSPRFSLAQADLSTGRYTLNVQATNSAGASPWASATINVVSADLSAIRVYPNPWKKDRHAGRDIIFDNLTANSTVKIFTVSGHLVRTLSTQDSGLRTGSLAWDLKNDKGDPVASGIYIYLVTDGQGNMKRGKVAVVL